MKKKNQQPTCANSLLPQLCNLMSKHIVVPQLAANTESIWQSPFFLTLAI